MLGEICLVHIFRSTLFNSSSFFNDFLTSIYTNILLRLFLIFLIFFWILFIYVWCVFCFNLSKAKKLICLCNFILTISFPFHMLSHFFPTLLQKMCHGWHSIYVGETQPVVASLSSVIDYHWGGEQKLFIILCKILIKFPVVLSANLPLTKLPTATYSLSHNPSC